MRTYTQLTLSSFSITFRSLIVLNIYTQYPCTEKKITPTEKKAWENRKIRVTYRCNTSFFFFRKILLIRNGN